VKKETIRLLDAWIGRAICFALTLHRRMFEGAPSVREAPRRVLFLKLIEQGATVLAAPAIQSAVSRVGRDNVYFLVFAENREILDILGLLPSANVVAVRHATVWQFAADAWRAIRRIRREGIDATIDMESFARAPAIIAYLTGASTRVGLHRFTSEGPYRGDLMTHRVAYNPYCHIAQHYQILVDSLDADPDDLPLLKVPKPASLARVKQFEPTDEERQRVSALLTRLSGRAPAFPIVLLNPNASDIVPLRRWPVERFLELGRRLLAHDPQLTLFITGSPAERSEAEALAKALGNRTFSVAGQTTVRELIVLYTLADVLVTNDSGPGHFATLTNIDSVVMFGPETPQLFGGLGERTHTLWAGLACSPCVNAYNHRFSPCTNNVCMQAITTDAVFAEVQQCLSRRAAERESLRVAPVAPSSGLR
jgi:ADP-heptose:LPS heptosyltransferase